jgi:hypothetical protein
MSICAASMSDRLRRRTKSMVAAGVATLTMTATWLAPLTMPAEERNLVAARNGGQVIKYTSERGGPWRAEKIIDEHAAPSGWASADGSLPQEIIVRLPAPSRFNTLVFNLDSGAPDDEWARHVSIYTADPFPTMGGWKLVATVSLARQTTDQTFTVAPTDGRFVRLLITAAQAPDAPRVSLGQFRLFLR